MSATGRPACPAWCSPVHCEVQYHRAHSGEPVAIGAERMATSARLQLRLWQAAAHAAPVLLELVVGDHDYGERLRVDLSLRQADALRRALGVALARAEEAAGTAVEGHPVAGGPERVHGNGGAS